MRIFDGLVLVSLMFKMCLSFYVCNDSIKYGCRILHCFFSTCYYCYCAQCRPNRQLNQHGTCECMTGFYDNHLNNCLPCDQNCVQCSTPDNICLRCQDRPDMQLFNGQCKCKDQRQLNTTSNECLCHAGHYKLNLNGSEECLSCGVDHCGVCEQGVCMACGDRLKRTMEGGRCVCEEGFSEGEGRAVCEAVLDNEHSIGAFAITGAVLGSLVLLTCFGCLVYCFATKKAKKNNRIHMQQQHNPRRRENEQHMDAQTNASCVHNSSIIQLHRASIYRSQQTCSICLDNNNTLIVTPCEHYFHFECIYMWLGKRHTCPNCNQAVSYRNLMKWCEKCERELIDLEIPKPHGKNKTRVPYRYDQDKYRYCTGCHHCEEIITNMTRLDVVDVG